MAFFIPNFFLAVVNSPIQRKIFSIYFPLCLIFLPSIY